MLQMMEPPSDTKYGSHVLLVKIVLLMFICICGANMEYGCTFVISTLISPDVVLVLTIKELHEAPEEKIHDDLGVMFVGTVTKKDIATARITKQKAMTEISRYFNLVCVFSTMCLLGRLRILVLLVLRVAI